MKKTHWTLRGLSLLLVGFGPWLPAAPAQAPAAPVWPGTAPAPAVQPSAARSALPLEGVAADARATVQSVMEQPTLTASGPAEEFPARVPVYQWLLDHPDRAARAWRQLGAPCLDITDCGDGMFNWTDSEGSNISWETVYRAPNVQAWYAEGYVKPGQVLPTLLVRVVLVMHYREQVDTLGRSRILHHSEVYLQTDNKTASALIKILGTSMPRFSEQALGQMQLFFSALAGYLQRHPERAEDLLSR